MNRQRGFTLVEVMIAVLVLSVGLLGLASTAALVTRMIGQGDRYSEATVLASRQIEAIRARRCAAVSNSETVGQYTVKWTLTSALNGRAQQVVVTVTSPTGRGTRSDTFYATVVC